MTIFRAGGTGRPARDGASGARPYAWLGGIVVAVPLVRWGSANGISHAPAIVRAVAAIAVVGGSGVLAMTPGVALVSVVGRRRQIGRATALGLLLAGSSIVAIAGFWTWFASPVAGRAADAVFLVACVAAIAAFGRRGDLRRADLSAPLALAFGVALVYTGLAYLQGGFDARPLQALSTRYWPQDDNEIPLWFAMRVAAHLPLSGYQIPGKWLFSDRPPLQTGFALLQWPLWDSNVQLGYQPLGTCLQLCWLPALWTVLRVRGFGTRRAGLAVLATAATGAAYFNSVYVWPKMLAGGLTLAALAILVSRDDRDRLPGTWILAVVLAVLGMLAHGGTAFAVIALLPFAWRLRSRITLRSLAACAAAAIVLYVPWLMFQRLVAPPGNRLLKWQLAGVTPIDSRGALQTLMQQYEQLSLRQLFTYKVTDNLAALAGDHGLPAGEGFMGYAWHSQFFGLLPAAMPLLLGAGALAFPSGRRNLAAARPLAVFLAITLAAWLALLWGGPIAAVIHQGPYALLVLFTGLCALAVTALPRPLAIVIALADLAWFTVCWIPGLGFPPGHKQAGPHMTVDAAMLTVGIAGLLVLAVACVGEYSRAARPSPPTPARGSSRSHARLASGGPVLQRLNGRGLCPTTFWAPFSSPTGRHAWFSPRQRTQAIGGRNLANHCSDQFQELPADPQCGRIPSPAIDIPRVSAIDSRSGRLAQRRCPCWRTMVSSTSVALALSPLMASRSAAGSRVARVHGFRSRRPSTLASR